MVVSLPLLAGAWVQRHTARWPSLLLLSAIAMSMVAVFMAASRSHALVLFAVTLATLFSGGLRSRRFGWIVVVAAVAWVVSGDERLQRFRTLEDTEYVTQRIAMSVNMGFFELAREFPLGNGLGGGGTSIPYFLQGRLRRPVRMENEYARIVLEQGLPGLALWLAFIIWVFTRRPAPKSDPWFLGRRLARVATAAYFCSGLIGIGLLTAIPHTGLFLLLTGWIAVPPDVEDQQEQPEPALDMTTPPIASQHASTA
jgi:O-antigen ligase